MAAVLVMIVPLAVGAALILLIARFSPQLPPDEAILGADRRPLITPDEFRDLVGELVAALGLHTVFSALGTGGVVEMTLRDPAPLSGGRILLRATPLWPDRVDAVEVLSFAEGVRAEAGTLKGVFIALGGFSREAQRSAGSSAAPLELIDGATLLALVREHIATARAEQLAVYRGFGPAVTAD